MNRNLICGLWATIVFLWIESSGRMVGALMSSESLLRSVCLHVQINRSFGRRQVMGTRTYNY